MHYGSVGIRSLVSFLEERLVFDRIETNKMVRYIPAKARLHYVRNLHRLSEVNDSHDGYIGKGTYYRDTNLAPVDRVYTHINNNIQRVAMYALTGESESTITSEDSFAKVLTRRKKHVLSKR